MCNATQSQDSVAVILKGQAATRDKIAEATSVSGIILCMMYFFRNKCFGCNLYRIKYSNELYKLITDTYV